MALPFRDNLEPRRTPWMTFLLILLNGIVFLFVQPSAYQTAPDLDSLEISEHRRWIEGDRFAMRWGLVPCEIVTGEPVAAWPDRCDRPPTPHVPDDPVILPSLLTAMFLHGNILHLAGNLFFLWVFGRNVEDRLGPLVHLAHHLLGGILAGLTSVLLSPASATPHIGASGAIAATMGAYLICHPRARILTQVAPPFQIVYLPAAVVLLLYFVTQFFIGSDSNVAWEAHAGGMIAGAVLALLALRLPSVRARARTDDGIAISTRSF